MTYKLVKGTKETAGVNPETFKKMIAYFKKYLNKELDVQYTTDDDTGAMKISFGIEADSGIDALSSAIISIKAAAQKTDLHIYVQKVNLESTDNEESGNKEYSITFEGICH